MGGEEEGEGKELKKRIREGRMQRKKREGGRL